MVTALLLLAAFPSAEAETPDSRDPFVAPQPGELSGCTLVGTAWSDGSRAARNP